MSFILENAKFIPFAIIAIDDSGHQDRAICTHQRLHQC